MATEQDSRDARPPIQTLQPVLDALHEHGPEPPEKLYHYTSIVSALAILNSDRPHFLASGCLCQNDSGELKYGLSLLEAATQKRFPTLSALIGKPEFLTQADVRMTTMISFCSRPDLLSQWRAYGSNGAGCAVGFDPAKLEHSVRPQKYALFPIIYDQNIQKLALDEVVNEVADKAGSVDSDPSSCIDTMVTGVLMSLSFKHPKFAEESEWRLISPIKKKLKYRANSTSVVPYEVVPFDPTTVNEIWQGPMLDQEMGKRTWEMFLNDRFGFDQSGVSKVKVISSDIPLRKVEGK